MRLLVWFLGICCFWLATGRAGAESAHVPQAHLEAVRALGLPIWTLPEASRFGYHGSSLTLDAHGPTYVLEYWHWNGEKTAVARLRCARTPQGGAAGRVLERQQATLKGFGAIEVVRYERKEGNFRPAGCRTGWIHHRGGYLQVTCGDLPLAQFAQLLETLELSLALKANPQARLVAMRATGVPIWHFGPGSGARLQSTRVEYSAGRAWHTYVTSYAVAPGQSLQIRGARGTPGEDTFRVPAQDQVGVRVPGLKETVAYHAGDRVLTRWIPSGPGYVRFDCEGMTLDRFANHLRQLRRLR